VLSPQAEDPAEIIDFDEALFDRFTIQETASNSFDLDGYNTVFDVTQDTLVDYSRLRSVKIHNFLVSNFYQSLFCWSKEF